MGRKKEMGLILILFCSTMVTSSSMQQIFSTESNYHQQSNREKHGQDGVTYQIGRKYSVVTVSHAGGARGVSAAGRGGGFGKGGRARGGAYATNAAGGGLAGNRHENNMGLLVAAVLAAIAHLYRLF